MKKYGGSGSTAPRTVKTEN